MGKRNTDDYSVCDIVNNNSEKVIPDRLYNGNNRVVSPDDVEITYRKPHGSYRDDIDSDITYRYSTFGHRDDMDDPDFEVTVHNSTFGYRDDIIDDDFER